MTQALPVSRLVNVSVNLTPAGAQAQNLATLLILGNSAVIDVVERYRDYTTLDQVASDFGTAADEYLAAVLWFEQIPQPTSLKIGRWAKTATPGLLRCAPLSAAQQAMSAWTPITTGAFTVVIDGAAPLTVSGLNFSAAANLNAVAAIIDAATAGATCVWNSVYSRFEFTSGTTGALSSIGFLTAPGAGSDISDNLAGRVSDSGAYRANGIALETAIAAVTLFDANYGQAWYAVTLVSDPANADHLAVAAFIEGTSAKHLYGVTTQEAGVLVAATTTDIAYQLAQLGYNKTVVQYSSSNEFAVVSALARIMTTDYTGNATVITLMYKQQPGIAPEQINSTEAASVDAKNCNIFVLYNNDTAIIQRGVCSSGNFVDIVTGTDWLAVALQNALYNVLYTSLTKIPQTDAGMNVLLTTAESICDQAVTNGLLAPGVWNSGGFGLLKQGDYLPKGFYVYAPRVSSQNPADRAARHSVPIQIAAKLAGAIHDINVSVSVNQ